MRDSFFAGRDFASLPAMQAAAVSWAREVAGRRSCRPLAGAQPLAVFAASERPVLGPLPAEPYELAVWSRPKVAADVHVAVEGALYSVPWRLVGRTVDARATARLVEVFVDGELVKTHVRARKGGKRTDWGDFPPEKVAFLERTPAWCRSRAAEAGEHVGRLVSELLAGNALHHLRAAQGVLRLAERYGPGRLDAACRRALAVGDPSYRTVKGILAAGADQTPLPPATEHATANQIPALLHGPAALVGDLPTPMLAGHHGDHDPGDRSGQGAAG